MISRISGIHIFSDQIAGYLRVVRRINVNFTVTLNRKLREEQECLVISIVFSIFCSIRPGATLLDCIDSWKLG